MAREPDRYVGDYGQVVRVSTPGYVSTGGTLTMKVRKPRSGTVTTWAATSSGEAVNHTLIVGDLDEPGLYEIEVTGLVSAVNTGTPRATLLVGDRL